MFLSKYFLVLGSSSIILSLSSCGGDGSPKLKDAQTKTITETTKGVITKVEEVAPGDDYKIVDETVIDDKSKSIAIVKRLDGKTDTLSLQKIKSDKSGTHSSLTNVLAYSLAASFLTRNLANTTPNSSYYKDANAYNKSTGLKNEMAKSTTTRKVSSPGKGSSGYGSGKSFRSYGG
jgi:hypothetical protein